MTRSDASNLSAVRKGRKRFQEAQLLITSLFRVYALQSVVLPNGVELQIRNRHPRYFLVIAARQE